MITVNPRGMLAVVRGDSFDLELSLNIGNPLNIINFNMQEGDIACLRIFNANDKWEDYMMSKEAYVEDIVEHGTEKFIKFTFNYEDTNFFEPDCYFFEMRMLYNRDGLDHILTITPRNKFVITN